MNISYLNMNSILLYLHFMVKYVFHKIPLRSTISLPDYPPPKRCPKLIQFTRTLNLLIAIQLALRRTSTQHSHTLLSYHTYAPYRYLHFEVGGLKSVLFHFQPFRFQKFSISIDVGGLMSNRLLQMTISKGVMMLKMCS